MISRLISLCFLAACIPSNSSVFAAPPTAMPAQAINAHDKSQLQRGAKIYINYCLGCHSLKYLRYIDMAEHLDIVNEQGVLDAYSLKKNLIFTQANSTDPILSALSAQDGQRWFGVAPPDLSLIVSIRTRQGVYDYLTGFYYDSARPFNSNNVILPNVAMPHILAPWSGKVVNKRNNGPQKNNLVLSQPGLMSSAEYTQTIADLVAFLTYVSEPKQSERYHLGYILITLLIGLSITSYFLKKMYWRQLK